MARMFQLVAALSFVVLAVGAATGDDKTEKKKGKGRLGPEAMFKKMDADGDGKVTKEEFTKFHEEVRKRAEASAKAKGKEKKGRGGPEAINRRFQMLDANGDGSISSEEFKQGLEKARAKREQLKQKRAEKKKPNQN